MVIVRWPAKPSAPNTRRFVAIADATARIFAAAVVRLAQLRRDRKLQPRLRALLIVLGPLV